MCHLWSTVSTITNLSTTYLLYKQLPPPQLKDNIMEKLQNLLSFFVNTLLDNNCLNFDNHFKFLPQTRTRDDLTITALNLNTGYSLFENYYFQRVAGSWNILPYDTTDALVSLEEPFPAKSILKEFLFQIFFEKFDTDSKCTWFLQCTCPICRITWFQY